MKVANCNEKDKKVEDKDPENCESGKKEKDSVGLAEHEIVAITKQAIKKHKKIRREKK